MGSSHSLPFNPSINPHISSLIGARRRIKMSKPVWMGGLSFRAFFVPFSGPHCRTFVENNPFVFLLQRPEATGTFSVG